MLLPIPIEMLLIKVAVFAFLEIKHVLDVLKIGSVFCEDVLAATVKKQQNYSLEHDNTRYKRCDFI